MNEQQCLDPAPSVPLVGAICAEDGMVLAR